MYELLIRKGERMSRIQVILCVIMIYQHMGI